MKRIFKVLPVVFILCFIITNVYAGADINIIDNILKPTNNGVGNVNKVAKNIWATIVTVVQILSVAAIVFAGVRYMFASADVKADIKRSMMLLAVGALLVFCSTTILSFIATASKNALGE